MRPDREPAAVDLSKVLNLADFEALAADRIDKPAFDYIAGGAGDEVTLADNVAAFRRWRLRPRVLWAAMPPRRRTR